MTRNLIKMNGFPLDNKHIKWGTYSVKKDKRLVGKWTDGNGLEHHEYFPNEKATITFTINQRSPETQAELNKLLNKLDEVTVEYYDAMHDTTRMGTFRLTAPELRQVLNGSKIWFAETKITLTEY